jgi:DNA-directed RNA polymerase subunit M/transcription elongation factor TFIIS
MTDQTYEEIVTSIVRDPAHRHVVDKALERCTTEDEKVFALYDVMCHPKDDVMCHPKGAVQRLRAGHFLFSHPAFDQCHDRLKQQQHILDTPIDVQEGAITCMYCKSQRTLSYTKQTRRSDEGMTVFVQCAQCRRQFRL